MELAKNVKALVEPQPTLREDSPAAGLKKTQRDDGSALAPESHSPGQYIQSILANLKKSMQVTRIIFTGHLKNCRTDK